MWGGTPLGVGDQLSLPKATRTNKSFIGVLWSAWSDGVVAHWMELIALEVEAANSSFTDLGPPQTRFTRSCVCPNLRRRSSRVPNQRSAPGLYQMARQ